MAFSGARGDEIRWRAATPRKATPASAEAVAPTLGAPVPLEDGPSTPADPNIVRTSYTARGQSPDRAPPTLAPPPGVNPVPATPEERYNCSVVADPPAGGGGAVGGGGPIGGGGHNFWDKCKNWCGGINFGGGGGNRCLFQSIHSPDMDQFASPVSDPFFFEDPRTLTEVRPIFMYQQGPGNQFVSHGGDMEYLGLQARIAITDRLSFVVNKLGGVWNEVNNSGTLGINDHVGFSELWLGPKYMFYRCDETRTVAAGGLIFQIPAGPGGVYQDTGTLSLTPYVTAAQNFGRSTYGSVNVLDTLGYSASVDHQRSSYIYDSLHFDYNVLNANRIYPLIEMTYLNYTQAGTSNNFGFEGRDLFNFGSTGVSGRNSLVLSLGARFKVLQSNPEMIQTGLAIGTPLIGPRDLYGFRVTYDLIFRY
jgi:hypothetical protein